MKIIYTARFKLELAVVVKFIALDSKKRALDFTKDLKIACQNLSFMPYKCRKSLSFDDENARDLIFKGFVLPYFIYENKIYILGIYKENLWF